eukprot:COSAG05_NODE_22149_length_267_cov_0.279762_1_plen_46_part_10
MSRDYVHNIHTQGTCTLYIVVPKVHVHCCSLEWLLPVVDCTIAPVF